MDKSYWIETYDSAVDAGWDDYMAGVLADEATRNRAMDLADMADYLEDR